MDESNWLSILHSWALYSDQSVCHHMHLCIYIYTCVCVVYALGYMFYVCMHVSTSPSQVCACTCLLKYVCVWECTHVCICTCLVTYSHTHKCAWQPEIDVLKHFLWTSLLFWISTSQWTWSILILPRLASQQDPVSVSPSLKSQAHTATNSFYVAAR